jgi:hypothetical protein
MEEKSGGAITRLWETINTPARPTVAVKWRLIATGDVWSGGKACVPDRSLRTCGARGRRERSDREIFTHTNARLAPPEQAGEHQHRRLCTVTAPPKFFRDAVLGCRCCVRKCNVSSVP